jgi:hypothetical protein
MVRFILKSSAFYQIKNNKITPAVANKKRPAHEARACPRWL